MITLKAVSKSFDKNIFNNINYEFKDKNFYIIEGENASGKSVLLELILGKIKPDKGSIERNFVKKDILYIPDSFIDDGNLTIAENMYFLCQGVFKRSKKEIDEVIKILKLSDICDNLNSVSSLGTRKKICISPLFCVNDRKIYLIDELFNGLDSDTVDLCINKLMELNKSGATIIMTNHIVEINNIISKKVNAMRIKVGGGKIHAV